MPPFSNADFIPLASPFAPAFGDFIQAVKTSCLLCSPYITRGPVNGLIDSFVRRGLTDTIQMHVITDTSLDNLISGATDVEALMRIKEVMPSARITYHPSVHAKVYIADRQFALITSANFTDGGGHSNLEYGVSLRDRDAINIVHRDIVQYAALGTDVTLSGLALLREHALRLRESVREERRSVHRKIREASEILRREAEDDLIRLRVRDRSVNAIFSDTILYLLARHPMTTEDLNSQISLIHPDLCDAADRVIDGKHYGKLWKHGVRGAQVTLRRQGHIDYRRDDRLWRMV